MPDLAFILDFDGTVTKNDVGAQLVDTFGEPDSGEMHDAFMRGEITIREHAEWEAGRLREARAAAMEAAAPPLGALRDGISEFVDFCTQNSLPVEIASNGMLFYVEEILGRNGLADVPRAAPVIAYDSDGKGVMRMPDGVRGCAMTGLCKCDRVWRLRRGGRQVMYVGDGMSDFCVAKQADFVMARASLAEFCDREGLAFTPFDDFYDVLAEARRMLI